MLSQTHGGGGARIGQGGNNLTAECDYGGGGGGGGPLLADSISGGGGGEGVLLLADSTSAGGGGGGAVHFWPIQPMCVCGGGGCTCS